MTSTLVNKLWRYSLSQGWDLATAEGQFEIFYIEGANPDGTPNKDSPNGWNDRSLIIQFDGLGGGIIHGNWEGTTEPGNRYTYNPMNAKGAARIEFGRYKAWQVGTHGNSEPHEALIQVLPITVCRDLNEDFLRTGDERDTGIFGINQHWGYDLPNIGAASAGCLLRRYRNEHRQFMQLVKSDKRYLKRKDYIFWSTIVDATKL